MECQNEKTEEKSQHPIAEAGFFSRLFFLYTFSSLRKSFDPKKPYLPLINDRSVVLGGRLESSWNKQIKKGGTKKTNVIFKSIFAAFWRELMTLVLVSTIEVVLRIAEPVCLGFVLSYFQPNSTMSKQEVTLWTIGMLAANGLRVITYAQQRYYTLDTTMKIRVACSNLIYRKVLRLRSTTLQEDGGGRIVTLMSNDLSRFDMRTELINYVYTAPLVVITVTFIVYHQFGLPGLVGVLFIFLISLIQAFLAHYVSSFQLKTSILTDERIRLIHSLLTGIQVMKMYTWERPFAKLIEAVRAKELDIIGRSFLVKAIYESVYTFIVPISIFLALYVVIEEHRKITVVMVFLLLIYYTLLNYIISIFFTLGVAKMFELSIVLKRVNEFLLAEERQIELTSKPDQTEDVFILLENVSASWDNATIDDNEESVDASPSNLSEKTSLLKTTKKKKKRGGIHSTYYIDSTALKGSDSLRGINLEIRSNQFIGIIGPVGSGKSSLLQVILGELLISTGTKKINGKISYAPQIAWTFASTIRQNILFGLEYNEIRYKEVVRVCGLDQDLKRFPNGDLTIVGDRGASLSGGQKARINLARAIYREADIYLLDDPLSAVDVRVANHLFNECILSFLGNKCRILVTHHVGQLRNSDHILCLNNGIIEKQGTYEDMIKSGIILDELETMDEPGPQRDAFKGNYSLFRNSEESLNASSTSSSSSSEFGDSSYFLKQVPAANLSEKTHEIMHNTKEKGLLLFKYILAGGNTFTFIISILLFVLNQVVMSGISFYLGVWTTIEEIRDKFSYLGAAMLRLVFGLHYKMFYEDWYGYLVLALCVAAILKACAYAKLVKSNSKKLHDKLLEKVTETNLRFFDITSSGRIMNRFSRDIGIIDEPLPRAIMEAAQILLMSIGSFVLLILVDVDFILPTIILNGIFIGLLMIFSRLTKKIKRVESRLVGPILSHVNNSAQGITTIKALSAEKVLTKEFESHQDNYTSSWFLYGTSSIALSFYIDLSCFLFLLYIALVLVLNADSLDISGGFVGVALTQAMSLTGVIQYGLRQTLEANNQLIAVERVSRYDSLEIEEEPSLSIEPSSEWPEEGKIVFEFVGLRYDPELPLVLKNLSFTIQPKEKVGIVGRTGAGKSSIMAALFRLTNVEGSIEIDGFDTRDLSLKFLRSRISVIPQDPILFAGSLRFNLDPFDEYEDSIMNKVIQAVDLKDPSGQYYSLDYQVMERGSNYSVGQRQLICLARALIRNNKILLMDEATANVDPGTDSLIQKTVRKEFSECTVLTVAHRLNTIMDSDRVMVMDSGQIVEFDHPHMLLQNMSGIFYNMVMETGYAESERLKKTAFESYIGYKK